MHTFHSHLDADVVDNFTQCRGTSLELLDLHIIKFLIEDCINSILTNNDWQTQEHFLLYAVITLRSAQYAVHSTQYTVHSAQYTVHSAQYTVHDQSYFRPTILQHR